MSPAQRDMFLWQWGQRRARGRLRATLLAAGIGALGGVAFTLMMFGFTPGELTLNTGEAAAAPAWAREFVAIIAMLAMAVPAFAGLAAFLAYRVWSAQEWQYQRLLETGAMPPAQKPAPLQGGDRAPQFAVFVAAGVITLFILFVAIFVA